MKAGYTTSFADILTKNFDEFAGLIASKTAADVEVALNSPPGVYDINKLAALVSPAAQKYLEQMAQASRRLTLQRFGPTIRMYAPLYLSNVCSNSCLYCGFNRTNDFQRTRLTIEQALAEADLIAERGFRDILLVSSEDRQWVTVDYLCELAGQLREKFAFISIEIYQLEADDYRRLFDAGIEGVTIYQETYDRDTYARYHPAGPKSDYQRRLAGPEAAAVAGMREVNLGALLGLAPWPAEMLTMAEHAHYLMKKYWKCHISFSFPRIRPACKVQAQLFDHLVGDAELVQMILALRLCFADAGLVLSTREGERLRDNLVKMGITKISAGSKTNPGGYSSDDSLKQFDIDDARSPSQVVQMLRHAGLEAVWKDWDAEYKKNA